MIYTTGRHFLPLILREDPRVHAKQRPRPDSTFSVQ